MFMTYMFSGPIKYIILSIATLGVSVFKTVNPKSPWPVKYYNRYTMLRISAENTIIQLSLISFIKYDSP